VAERVEDRGRIGVYDFTPIVGLMFVHKALVLTRRAKKMSRDN
jgi:hypothetical protein